MNPLAPVLMASHSAVRARRLVAGPARPTWDDRYETFATLMHHWAKRSTWFPLGVQRGALTRLARPTTQTEAVTWRAETIGGVYTEWAVPPGADPRRVFVYLHGGGYSIGSIASHRDVIARIARLTGFPVLGVEYRLAPEARFPAQLDDALAVYRALLGRHEPEHVVIGGESAGGGLTLSTLVALRDAGDALPAAGACLSPWFDLEALGASVDANARYDYILRPQLHEYASRFVHPADRRNPLAAPLYADLRGLPPLLLQAGDAESLRDDSLRVAERAEAAGVVHELEIWPDMIHAFQLFAPMFAVSRSALGHVASFARRRTHAEPMDRAAAV